MVKAVWIPGGGELGDVFSIREKVFVIEQGFDPDTDRDDVDTVAWHVLLKDDELPCGTGRLYIDDLGRYCLGRICVLSEYRGQGFGDLLVRMMVLKAIELGADEVHLGAQLRVKGFYEKLGFKETGDFYDEEGVAHTHMTVAAVDVKIGCCCAGK